MGVAGPLLRAARQSRKLSTRALATASGASQPGISSVENGRADATVTRLDKLLASLDSQLSILPTRLRPALLAADDIRGALARADERTALREVVQLSDDLQRADPATRVALVIAPPATTGQARYDALLAAVVDVILSRDGLPRPAWLDEPSRALGDPWDLEPVPALRAAARAVTPPAAARHGIYLDPAELVSV